MQHSSNDLLNRPSTVSSIYKIPDSEISSYVGSQRSLVASCRICLSSIFSPAALTCGHRFCERCLEQYWRVGEKPPCIVCPLCRACAFNVNFTKADKEATSEDFRRTFSPVAMTERGVSSTLMWCIEITVLLPVVYFLLKWLKSPVLHLFKRL